MTGKQLMLNAPIFKKGLIRLINSLKLLSNFIDFNSMQTPRTYNIMYTIKKKILCYTIYSMAFANQNHVKPSWYLFSTIYHTILTRVCKQI